MNVCVKEPCLGGGRLPLPLPLPLPVRSAGNLLPVFQASGGDGEVGEEREMGEVQWFLFGCETEEEEDEAQRPTFPSAKITNLELSGLPVMQTSHLPQRR